jgi:hypothetical protein
VNERIRELAEQAGMEDYPIKGVPGLVGKKEIEKFAELIVRECAEIAKEIAFKYQVNENTYSAGKKAGALEVAHTVKEHFGVAE